MYKKVVLFSFIILILCSTSTLGEELFTVNDCVLSDSCKLEMSKLKKYLLHATGMFEVLDDPNSGLDEIKIDFYVLNRRSKKPIYMGVINMWADDSVFVLQSSQNNDHNLELSQAINFGQICDIVIIDIDNDGNDDIKLTNFPKGTGMEPISVEFLNKDGKLKRP